MYLYIKVNYNVWINHEYLKISYKARETTWNVKSLIDHMKIYSHRNVRTEFLKVILTLRCRIIINIYYILHCVFVYITLKKLW